MTMASTMPSSLFLPLTNVWRALVLRSDVNDIVLELLGRFSLERMYADASDRDTYQQLVITLLSQLKSIFDIQRLTLSVDNVHTAWYLGFLVSWEVALRSVEFVLQTINESRETIWENRLLRERYLAGFLLSSLRVLTLHPKSPAIQRSRDRRERFSRIHGLLEQVFDSFPGPNSFPLAACKEITTQLHLDPDSLGLPPALASGLPNLASQLSPFPPGLQPAAIADIVPAGYSGDWLVKYLALRDVSQFVVAASIQYAASKETRELRLEHSRNAVLSALDALLLPDTLDLSHQDTAGICVEECELDALDALFARLVARQAIHHVSDREMVHNMSQVIRNIALQDTIPFMPNQRPGLYSVNCPECHIIGASQLNPTDINTPTEHGHVARQLPPKTRCIHCGEAITIAREISTVRQTWELLEPLRLDADTVSLERHLPTQFLLRPPKPQTSGFTSLEYGNTLGIGAGKLGGHEAYGSSHQPKMVLSSPVSIDPIGSLYTGLLSPQSLNHSQSPLPLHNRSKLSDHHDKLDPALLTDRPTFSHDSPIFKQLQHNTDEASSINTPRSVPVVTSAEKGKSKWRLKFTTSKKPPAGVIADSSSLSSTTLEAQKARGNHSDSPYHPETSREREIVEEYQCYSFAKLYPCSILDLAAHTCPESTCILAAIARTHLAYVIGTRDQKLTLRIVNLVQPTVSVIEYRIPSTLWAKALAIDREENYDVFALKKRTVAFFQDGFTLLASTRSSKTGLMQIFSWRFPFHEFQELAACRYLIPLHESEDNGLSAAIFRPGSDGEETLVCITTWTQFGTPILIQPQDGHRSEIKVDGSGKFTKLGTRIQCAAFSPSGRELVIINDRGYVFQVSNLNSSPIDTRRVANSKELTAKSELFAMSFVTIADEENVLVAWVDSARATGWIKKIPMTGRVSNNTPLWRGEK
ncbi:LOW QUALITY PROTEIN: hypothetical protein QC762_505330 [Podospora pseudocomata]|uniref:Uncharacterized protein n=1 Tax=Podospora pseudocomata TaxID=2093779 RepID=A0ABR0GBJ1_9PEZI|nr:LOW QUALITY PROTEIN: hypothetical protein QC762_505330 [Podospora pseudocomata]